MKKEFLTAAALLTLGVNAQVSGTGGGAGGASAGVGPGAGAGTSSGTFQAPAAPAPISPPVPNAPITTAPRPFTTAPRPFSTAPRPGALTSPQPQTRLGTPNATAGATDPFRSTTTPTMRPNGSINDSRDWERSVGGPATGDFGEDRGGQLTPPPDIVGPVRPLTGGGSTTVPGSGITSDLNMSGINTPPAVPEQPLDRSLSAKIRSQLSLTPRSLGTVPRTGEMATTVSPETVRDLRITSRNGTVVLEGTANSEAERASIEAQARRVQGVANTENRLTVRNPSPVGAPGSAQSDQSQQLPDVSTGQTPQNSTDLRNESRELTPDL